MANNIQVLQVEGYLAADPEMRYMPNGNAVTNFRIGSNHQYKDKEGNVVKETTWFKVAAFGKLAEIVNSYCAKGSRVVVFGRLRPGENGSPTVFQLKSGEYGASYEVTAKEVYIIKGKDKVAAGDTSATPETPYVPEDDELPF